MGAYKVIIGGPPKCNKPACIRKATHAVYNTLNERAGVYCSKHADVRVSELNDPKVIATQIGRRL
jgi:hypothetical protein